MEFTTNQIIITIIFALVPILAHVGIITYVLRKRLPTKPVETLEETKPTEKGPEPIKQMGYPKSKATYYGHKQA